MSSFITQCPHCHTSFRISRSQLGAAHGAVRCGACLEVFNAARHLQPDETAAPQPSPPPAANVTPPATSPSTPAATTTGDATLWIHDDLDLDSLDLDEELAKLEAQERQFAQELAQRDAALRPIEEPPRVDYSEPAEPEAQTAQSSVDTAPPPPTPTPTPTPETIEDEESLHLTPVSASAPLPPSPLAVSADGPLTARLQHDALVARREPHADDAPELDEPELPATPVNSRAPEERREPELPNQPLFELEDEPLQLAWQQRKKPWGRWLAWGVLNLLALLVLIGQYVAYNFEELARHDRYRPWLEQLCPTLGCTLPAKVDVSQIRSSNLVVRSHPDFSGALVVDAILYNRAPFSQPFPLLEMRFADLNGKLIASRSFKPSEYLSGELAGQAEMPPQVPIHIALDILDPGTKAVNYSLNFQSPE